MSILLKVLVHELRVRFSVYTKGVTHVVWEDLVWAFSWFRGSWLDTWGVWILPIDWIGSSQHVFLVLYFSILDWLVMILLKDSNCMIISTQTPILLCNFYWSSLNFVCWSRIVLLINLIWLKIFIIVWNVRTWKQFLLTLGYRTTSVSWAHYRKRFNHITLCTLVFNEQVRVLLFFSTILIADFSNVIFQFICVFKSKTLLFILVAIVGQLFF